MDDESRAFFHTLVETPSPSGYEQPVQKVVREWAETYAEAVRTDLHGNLVAVRNPKGHPRILLDGHCDQIGLLVQYMDEEGFLYCQPIGGWDPHILLGQKMTVWTDAGAVPGVIARKPKHLLTLEEQRRIPKIPELWIDIGVESRSEAMELVAIGDPVTLSLGVRRLRGDRVYGPKLDDATGLYVVFETLRRLADRDFPAALHVVSAVQEEIGLRGARTAAHGVDPTVAIAVDVTHATDYPTMDKRTHGDVRLGQGPVLMRGANINPVVFNTLKRVAGANDLPFQVAGAHRGLANDTNPLQLTRAGVATACVGIPNRYMHSPVEIVSLADLDAAVDLLTHFVVETPRDSDFVP